MSILQFVTQKVRDGDSPSQGFGVGRTSRGQIAAATTLHPI